ncbi:MAG: MFS transporter [Planctomycetota bacterium]
MIKPEKLKALLSKQENVVPLCSVAFLQSCSGGVWFVAMPFILKRLGGTDTQLGLCLGFWFVAYTIGCLSAAPLLDKFDPKRTILLGLIANVLATFGMLLVVIMAQPSGSSFSPPVAMILLSSISGVFGSLFWPPLMGWFSTGYEGVRLNRRLGLFNASWSCGALATPYFGGLIVEQSSAWALALTLAFSLAAVAALIFARSPNGVIPAFNCPDKQSDDLMPTLLGRFRWIARVALLSSMTCIGLARTQLAVLFKFELAFTESDYGSAILAMSIAVFAVFTLAGRTHAWHYKLWLFISAQLLLLIGMVLILYTSALVVLTLAVVMIGAGESFMYTSHLYYGVSGGKRRSARMAIHETTLSMGFAAGGLAGGLLSDHFGRYSPYKFGFGIVAAGLVVQAIIWLALKPKKRVIDQQQ